MLTRNLQRELLGIARSAIKAALQNKQFHTGFPSKVSPELMRPGGAFVTLRTNGKLRGCIGYMESRLPLAEVVREVAVKAASEDPRFSPLSIQELDRTDLEISVLSPLRRIRSKDEITIGEHGLLIESGPYRGVLLPQVAVEYGWNVDEFLEAVCTKAGVDRFAWKDPSSELMVFTAQVIDEENFRHEPAV